MESENKDLALEFINQELDKLYADKRQKIEIVTAGLRKMADYIERHGPTATRSHRINMHKSVDFVMRDLV